MGIFNWRNGTRHEPRTRPNGQANDNQQTFYIGSLLDQANQPAYRQRFVGKNIGIAYEQPRGTEPCLLAVGVLNGWEATENNGARYVRLEFAGGASMDRNRLNIVAGAELFLPSAVICTRKREFAGLADRVAGLIMEDNTMGVRMEDYYNVLNRANRDLK